MTIDLPGTTDVRVIFVSMAAREPDGRDADYLAWHSLDHRPEQYRLAGLRHSMLPPWDTLSTAERSDCSP